MASIASPPSVPRIATGETTKEFDGPREKSAGAIELGRRGGRKRADSLSAERRSAIARKAAEKLQRLRLPPYR
jgi:hypothetical protein